MGPARFDQLVPSFSYGDAIGNHVLALRDILRRRRPDSEIFALMSHPRVRAEAREWREYEGADAPENVCLLHFSIGTPLAYAFARLRSRRAIVYHNITPPRFAGGISSRMERECRLGRHQLRYLAGHAELAIGVSEFNRRELAEAGFERTEALPVIVDFSAYDRAVEGGGSGRREEGWTTILHVGRFAPNKRLEDVVKAFHVYKRINPRSRLVLAGSDAGFENYSAAVLELAGRLGAADVHAAGHVDFDRMCALYRAADLYLVMSEHEGFCVPLLEAMHFGVPIVAFAAGAIPETLGGAGILVREKRFAEVAELMHLVLTDGQMRERLVAAGRRRLEDFAPERIAARFWEILERHGLAPG